MNTYNASFAKDIQKRFTSEKRPPIPAHSGKPVNQSRQGLASALKFDYEREVSLAG